MTTINLSLLRHNLSFPVMMKETRSRMRGIRAPLLLLVSAGLAVVIAISILSFSAANLGGDPAQNGERMAEVGRLLFNSMIVLEAVLAALMAPAFTSGAIALEHEQRTLEFLLLTRLSVPNIILGKLFSSLGFLVLVLLSALPVTALAFVFGGVSLQELFLSQLLIGALILCFGAIGICCSSCFNKTAVATTVSYIVCIAWAALLPLLRLLLDIFNGHGGYEADILLSLTIAVGILLVISTVPTVAISALFALLRNRRLSRAVNMSMWGLFATLACLLLYLPGALDAMQTDYFLFANPAVALYQIMGGELTHSSSYYSYPYTSHPPSLVFYRWFSVIASIAAMLLASWGALALAVLQVRRRTNSGPTRRGRKAAKLLEKPAEAC